MSKFTPGPWVWESSGSLVSPHGEIIHDEPYEGLSFDGGRYDTATRTFPEMEANKRLVAAAPDLYEALKRAKPILGAAAAGATNETRDLRTKIYDEVCAALAKVDA